MNRFFVVWILLSGFFALALASGAIAEEQTTDGWLMKQYNPHTGQWTVEMCDQGMRADNPLTRISIVSAAPKWDVIMYNDETRTYFASPIEQWSDVAKNLKGKDATAITVALDNAPTKIAETKVLGFPVSVYVSDNLKTHGVKKIEFKVAETISPPGPLQRVFSKIYGINSSLVKGTPIAVSYVNETGTRTPVFDTLSIKKGNIPLADLKLPDGYTRCTSDMEVMLDARGHQILAAVMDDSLSAPENLAKLTASSGFGAASVNVGRDLGEDLSMFLPSLAAASLLLLIGAVIQLKRKKPAPAAAMFVVAVGAAALTFFFKGQQEADWKPQYEAGLALYQRGDLDTARKSFFGAALSAKNSKDASEEEYLEILKRLAWCYEEQGYFGKARAVMVLSSKLSPEKAIQLKGAQALAYPTLASMEKFMSAGITAGPIAASKASAHFMEGQLGPDDPGLIPIYALLGQAYSQSGDFADAESSWTKVISIREKTQGPQSVGLANGRAKLADLYVVWAKKQLESGAAAADAAHTVDEAIRGYEDASRIYTKLFGPEFPELSKLAGRISECNALRKKTGA